MIANSSITRGSRCLQQRVGSSRRLVASVGVLLLLALIRAGASCGAAATPLGAEPAAHSGSHGVASVRQLLQQHEQQQQQQEQQQQLWQPPADLLEQLADDADDDPFAASRSGPALHPHQQQPSPQEHAHAHKQHHRQHISRSSGNASWVWSSRLQMELPQPWDTVNLTRIVRDNLEPDLVFWQQQLQREPSVQDILAMAQSHKLFTALPNTRRLVEIRGNMLRFPLMPPGPKQTACDEDCDPQLQGFTEAMHAAVHVYHLTLPDVLFLVNTEDAAVCIEEQVIKGECSAPVISLSKTRHGIADLLAPVMRRSDADVVAHTQPWDSKLDKAFFRGVPSCGEMPHRPGCARSWVARLAQTNHSRDLDAGIVERYGTPAQVRGDPVLRDGHGPLPVLPRAPLSELSKHRWLLNLDGHAAAYRLSTLLAVNSLVLKQESDFLEYYYRSLVAYHHYVPIFIRSEHDLMPRLTWARHHEAQVQRIIAHANAFALRYTTYKARCMYWVYVLHAYKTLVPDMDAHFGEGEQPEAAAPVVHKASSTRMEDLLRSHLAAVQQRQASA